MFKFLSIGEIVQVSMDNYYPFPRNEEKKRAFANRAAIWLYHDDAATKVNYNYKYPFIVYTHISF